MNKLDHYGVHGPLLKWFSTMLRNRTQRVRIGNAISSDEIAVTSGVGQGSNLGPLLFLININDVKFSIKFSRFLLFADDLKLFKSIGSNDDAFRLQSDLTAVNEWCKNNGMILEVKKCKVVTYGRKRIVEYDYLINNFALTREIVYKDLGIYFDTKLSFQQHIDYIQFKGLRIVNFIKRNSCEFRSGDTFRKMYFSYVYPCIMYGSQIWGSLNNG